MCVATNSAFVNLGEALFLCEFHLINSVGDFIKINIRTFRTFFLVEADDCFIAGVLRRELEYFPTREFNFRVKSEVPDGRHFAWFLLGGNMPLIKTKKGKSIFLRMDWWNEKISLYWFNP